MTTVYKFKAYYTDAGVGTAQDPAPTCTVINMADDSKLADAQATTASTNMPGLYSYEYSGADGLDCVALFATTDTGCDVKQLASYVSEKITTNLNADVAGVETKLDTVDANVDSILADTGTDGVVLASTQGAITWAQQKIVANVASEGALDIYNSRSGGYGIYSHATVGAKFAGTGAFLGYGTGLEIKGDKYGLHIANIGNAMEAALRIVNQTNNTNNGLYIGEQGTTGYRVQGYVSGYDSAILTNVEETINEALNVTNALLTNELDEFTDSAPKAMQLPPEEGA